MSYSYPEPNSTQVLRHMAQAIGSSPHPAPPIRPSLKRSRTYQTQHAFPNSCQHQHTDSDRVNDGTRSSEPTPSFDVASLNPSSDCDILSLPKTATLSPHASTQPGTSRPTSMLGQYLGKLARPMKRRRTLVTPRETLVTIPTHYRGTAITSHLYPSSAEYSKYRFQNHLHNEIAFDKIATSSGVSQRLDGSDGEDVQSGSGNPHESYGKHRHSHEPGTGPDQTSNTPSNPLTPTPATNRDANTAPHMWQALQPGSPGISHGRRHTMSYFPLPSEEQPHDTSSGHRHPHNPTLSQSGQKPNSEFDPSPLTRIWHDDGTLTTAAASEYRGKQRSTSLPFVRFM